MPQDAPPSLPPPPGPLAVWGVILVCSAIELVLQAADHGLIGTARWRPLSYQYGAFWAGLLHGWQPNYPLQPWAMFVTYGFLHAGFSHLLGNMLVLGVGSPGTELEFAL